MIDFTKNTEIDYDLPLCKKGILRKDVMKKTKFDAQRDRVLIDVLSYLPEDWCPAGMKLNDQEEALYIFHVSNTRKFYQYVHKRYLLTGEGGHGLIHPNEYCTMIERVVGKQPSMRTSSVVGLEIPLTRDYFDLFFPRGKTMEEYTLFMSTLYYEVGGSMNMYEHGRNKMDVHVISLKSTMANDLIYVEDIAVKMHGYLLRFHDILDNLYDYNERPIISKQDDNCGIANPPLVNFSVEIQTYEDTHKEEKEAVLEPEEIRGAYKGNELVNNYMCTECMRLRPFLLYDLTFKEKKGLCEHYSDGEYLIKADSYNDAMCYYSTLLLHKYHDKSNVQTEVPYVIYAQKRIIEDHKVYMECTDGFRFESIYGKRDFFYQCVHPGETYRDTMNRLYDAVDMYYKSNPYRSYLKSEGGKVSYVKFVEDLKNDPMAIVNVCPMLMVNRNQVYWRDRYKYTNDNELEVLLWCAYDLGFRWTTEAYGLGGTYCYRLVDYDMGRIEQTFLCPLSNKLLMNAVVTPEGTTYDKIAILEYIRLYGVDPKTRLLLTREMLIPNKTLMAVTQMAYLGRNKVVGEE
jgi:hypothetical protein